MDHHGPSPYSISGQPPDPPHFSLPTTFKHGTRKLSSSFILFFLTRGFFGFFVYFIQHSDSTMSEDAGIEPRTVATVALAVGRSNLLG